MNEIEKLFRRISATDRRELDALLALLESDPDAVKAIKLKGSDFYRARKGRFRIIFHYEKGVPVVDSIRLRSEKTYRDF